jgi:phenylacetic acid degradation operon negative regulatory protein
MDWKITPKILIISMLHVSNNRAMPIKVLIAMGNLFGFSGNTIRVTTTRLVRDGRIESDERGLYRLKGTDTPISRFVDSWRSEESRVKDWDGSWICCLLPKATVVQQRKNSKALALLGFREGLPQLWVRPNNLTLGLAEIRELQIHQGMDTDSEIFLGGRFSPRHVEMWKRDLWPEAEIIRISKAAREQLERSMVRLESLPVKKALVES